MFRLGSKITIDGKRFDGIHDVTIKRSIHEPGATATIKVPVTAVLRQQGNAGTKVEIAQHIKVGNEVEIQLCYDGRYNCEFRGFVKMLNLKTPLEIVCEDMFYKTREKNVTLQKKDTLAGILKKCGLNVACCADMKFNNFTADNKPVSWILGKLKSDHELSVFFDIDGKVYAMTKSQQFKGETVRYRLRWNVIKDDDLQFNVEGYKGKITTFLEPFAVPTMVARIEDPKYKERDGEYYIESTEVQYGRNGARRTVEIGKKA